MFNYVTTRRYPDGVSGRLKEAEARWYFQQLILAVDYLHKMVWGCVPWGAQMPHLFLIPTSF